MDEAQAKLHKQLPLKLPKPILLTPFPMAFIIMLWITFSAWLVLGKLVEYEKVSQMSELARICGARRWTAYTVTSPFTEKHVVCFTDKPDQIIKPKRRYRRTHR